MKIYSKLTKAFITSLKNPVSLCFMPWHWHELATDKKTTIVFHISGSFQWLWSYKSWPVPCWSYRIWPWSRPPPISPVNVYANADPLAVLSQSSCENRGLTVIQIEPGFTSGYGTGSSWRLLRVFHPFTVSLIAVFVQLKSQNIYIRSLLAVSMKVIFPSGAAPLINPTH